MKKLFFTLSIICLTIFGASAQLQKGSTMVGGGIGSMGFQFGSGANFSMNLTPRVGYFIQDNVAIGGKVDLGFHGYKGNHTFDYGLNAFGRYYFGPKEFDTLLKEGRWFMEAGAGIGGKNGAAVGVNLNVGPGYAYFLNEHVAVEGLVLLDTTLGTGTATGLTFNVGFQIYFPSSKYKAIKKQFD